MNGMFTGYNSTYSSRSYNKKTNEKVNIDLKKYFNLHSFSILFFLITILILTIMLYNATNLTFKRISQKVVYDDMLARNHDINSEILKLNQKISDATNEATISYKASKEIGMVRRNNKNAIMLTVPVLICNQEFESIQVGTIEQYSPIKALASIIN